MNSAELDFGSNPLNLPPRDLSDLEFKNIYRANKSWFDYCCIPIFVIILAMIIFTFVQTLNNINNIANISSLNSKMEIMELNIYSLVESKIQLEKKNQEYELDIRSLKQSINYEINNNNNNYERTSIMIDDTNKKLTASLMKINQTLFNEIAKNKNDQITNDLKNLDTISNIISSIEDQIELLQFPDNSFNKIDNDVELSENGRVCTSLNSTENKWVLGKLYYCLNNANGSVFSFEFHVLKKSSYMFFGILDSSIDRNYNDHLSYSWEGSFGWGDNFVYVNGSSNSISNDEAEYDIIVLTLNLELNSLSFENKRAAAQFSTPIPENRSWVVHCNFLGKGDKIRFANHTRLK